MSLLKSLQQKSFKFIPWEQRSRHKKNPHISSFSRYRHNFFRIPVNNNNNQVNIKSKKNNNNNNNNTWAAKIETKDAFILNSISIQILSIATIWRIRFCFWICYNNNNNQLCLLLGWLVGLKMLLY